MLHQERQHVVFCTVYSTNFHLISLAQKKLCRRPPPQVLVKIPVNSSFFGADNIYTKKSLLPESNSLSKCSVPFWVHDSRNTNSYLASPDSCLLSLLSSCKEQVSGLDLLLLIFLKSSLHNFYPFTAMPTSFTHSKSIYSAYIYLRL